MVDWIDCGDGEKTKGLRLVSDSTPCCFVVNWYALIACLYLYAEGAIG